MDECTRLLSTVACQTTFENEAIVLAVSRAFFGCIYLQRRNYVVPGANKLLSTKPADILCQWLRLENIDESIADQLPSQSDVRTLGLWVDRAPSSSPLFHLWQMGRPQKTTRRRAMWTREVE
jgi:hypothetical protein